MNHPDPYYIIAIIEVLFLIWFSGFLIICHTCSHNIKSFKQVLLIALWPLGLIVMWVTE